MSQGRGGEGGTNRDMDRRGSVSLRRRQQRKGCRGEGRERRSRGDRETLERKETTYRRVSVPKP